MKTFPSYLVSTVPIHEIQLRTVRVINDKPRTSVIIHEENAEEEEDSNEPMNDAILEDVNISKVPVPTHPPHELI